MKRDYYSATFENFRTEQTSSILGKLVASSQFSVDSTQRDAWISQIELLKSSLPSTEGKILFEYSIPRMGKRIDVVLLCSPFVMVIEFKVGADSFAIGDRDQVIDYALDLHNFHECSHNAILVPILVATNAHVSDTQKRYGKFAEIVDPICISAAELSTVLTSILSLPTEADVDLSRWHVSPYKPTPTIIEAALALYRGHSVQEISRSDASAYNLSRSSKTISDIVELSKENCEKSLVLLTGVPGAGKTLVGLNIATKYIDDKSDLYSVFLSGNGPLVNVLQEALARDLRNRDKSRIGEARSKVKAFIQNIHHFRDEGLVDTENPPTEHVVLFDEAQRAWNASKTIDFMKRKKGQVSFTQSEPEFLISYMDRHQDWATIICLVGGGQEIHTGEAGISEWVDAIERSFPSWKIYASDQIVDAEYGGQETCDKLLKLGAEYRNELHLRTSLRSFRTERVSEFVKRLLDVESRDARVIHEEFCAKYPIKLTRSFETAREWLRTQARGSERYGLIMSSYAERLRPLGLHQKSHADPVKWFLEGKEHIDSSYYLELAATEFQIQGLELDWACVAWDADLRFNGSNWENWQFRGKRWQKIRQPERRAYQKNAYRVLLTRARQGMIVVVPPGSIDDPTRQPAYYDSTFDFLESAGLEVLS